MKVLAIETATPRSAVALGVGRDVVAAAQRVDRRGHSAFLVPALDFCFDQAGWSASDLDAVVIDVGPGLYTGIRVGLATALGLAAAVGVPLFPVTSLDALAYRATTHRRHIWALVDVRRGEVAVASYRPVPGGVVKEEDPVIVGPDRFRDLVESDPDDVLIVGDVSVLPGGLLRGLHRVRVGWPRYPSPAALLDVAAGPLERGDPHRHEVRALYLREPDVTINWSVLREEGPWVGRS